ncbi:tyrosine-protein phosphatase [Piscinibacter sakaiensis]|uniref:Uncharacterized protein n=1 Tax=Piscinibacter sakaiensis TaxID=1547922 RepID=A0A0K8P5Z1_PISS1|nr:tyrosine-protein phosphatase [Piscinibacter sakaiensis]GAP38123.1 hypothetical protein ISF6_4317 [Piscinibacter sakaiensis]
MTLLALGVSRDAILDDFLVSNERWQPTDTSRDWTVISQVRAEYLDTAFAAIAGEWGSVDAYLDRALGLGAAARERLAARLLTDDLTRP